jgi:hypothetical protein
MSKVSQRIKAPDWQRGSLKGQQHASQNRDRVKFGGVKEARIHYHGIDVVIKLHQLWYVGRTEPDTMNVDTRSRPG